MYTWCKLYVAGPKSPNEAETYLQAEDNLPRGPSTEDTGYSCLREAAAPWSCPARGCIFRLPWIHDRRQKLLQSMQINYISSSRALPTARVCAGTADSRSTAGAQPEYTAGTSRSNTKKKRMPVSRPRSPNCMWLHNLVKPHPNRKLEKA